MIYVDTSVLVPYYFPEPLSDRVQLLDWLHARWGYLLRSLPPGAFERTFHHPETQDVVPLWRALAYYVWHAHHHTAQIEWVKTHTLGVS